ncbi:MAG: hypothetical protein HY063_02040 [Bacteroidetes bacterium]|nr:hypothetical protein [Bacteroidota bacterium]
MKKIILHSALLLSAFFLPLGQGLLAQNISVNTSGAANSTLSMLEVLQISTTASTKGLHIAHSGAIAGTGYGIWAEKTGASTTNIAGYFSASGATNNYALIVPSTGGRVGFGTITPLYGVQVDNTGDVPFLFFNTTSGVNKRTRINFGQTGTLGMEIGSDYSMNNTNDLYFYNRATGATGGYMNPGTSIWFSARSTSADFYMTNAGNTGIGTITPGTTKLDVVGPATGSGITIYADGGGDIVSASGGSLFFDGNYSYAGGNYIRPIGGANTQGFYTSGTQRMRILSGGQILVNNTGASTYASDLFEVLGNATYPDPVNGLTSVTTGTAVYGENTAASGGSTGDGVDGYTAQYSGYGMWGGNGNAGVAGSYNAIGIRGDNTAAAVAGAGGSGVAGSSSQPTSAGTIGWNFNSTGTGLVGLGNNLATATFLTVGSGGAFTGNQVGLYANQPTASNTLSGSGYNSGNSYDGVLCDANVSSSSYHFGLHGTLQGSGSTRSGAVLGYKGTSGEWGSIGYRTSGSANYSGYFVGTAIGNNVGTGRMANSIPQQRTSMGIGVYGDVGSWIRGNIYGLNIKGERYSMYVDGKSYTNDVIAQLNDNGPGADRTVSYVPTSTSVDVYAKGTAALTNGKAFVRFDRNYSSMVSSEVPVIVTVTPMGKSSGVYIESVSAEGFTVVENNNGTSNVQLSWIAVGTKKGYEKVETPKELLSPEYDSNMNEVMFNENDLEHAGKPMWWDGSKLRFDATPLEPVAVKDESIYGHATLAPPPRKPSKSASKQ